MNIPVTIDLDPADLATVLQILKRHIPEYDIWAFGSRVKHTAKKFSDLDLVIKTSQPLSLAIFGELKDAFSQSDLPIKVDILDWSRIDPEFQELIQGNHVLLNAGN